MQPAEVVQTRAELYRQHEAATNKIISGGGFNPTDALHVLNAFNNYMITLKVPEQTRVQIYTKSFEYTHSEIPQP